MKSKRMRVRCLVKRTAGVWVVSMGLMAVGSGCSSRVEHRGRLPFLLVEKAPRVGPGERKMKRVEAREGGKVLAADLRPGDVVAFQMSQQEAWRWIRAGKVQKVPYDFFRYGHLALVVPDPEGGRGWRLLQVAMGQAVQADSGPEYLEGKEWRAFRPEEGAVDEEKLRRFTELVLEKASDPKKVYDWWGVAGIRNETFRVRDEGQIGGRYTCATLVVAALDYSGYSLDAVHRGGWLDLVTPLQVVESGGCSWRQ